MINLACPSGCACVFPDDPDMHECACDGICVTPAWDDLRVLLTDPGSRDEYLRLHWELYG